MVFRLMMLPRKFVFAAVVCALVLTVGCEQFRHKKKLAQPTRANAPTIQMPLPDAIPVPEEPAPVVLTHEPPAPAPPALPPKPHRRSNSKKVTAATTPANSQNAAGGATTAVAANHPPEPPPDTAIAAELTTERVIKDKQTTAELLDSAEKALNSLDEHSLTDDQKAIVSQIRSYIGQSKKATTDGDLERALNLANKAHLLSDALLKK